MNPWGRLERQRREEEEEAEVETRGSLVVLRFRIAGSGMRSVEERAERGYGSSRGE
jgi:hypothetical protein